jgi:hypothetical protein
MFAEKKISSWVHAFTEANDQALIDLNILDLGSMVSASIY